MGSLRGWGWAPSCHAVRAAHLRARGVIKEPVGLAGQVAIVLVVEGLEISRPHVLHPSLGLVKFPQCMRTHDGDRLFA